MRLFPTPKEEVNRVIEFMQDHDLEIVSFGLAPNPNGFCFESPKGTSEAIKRKCSRMLDSLSQEAEEMLRGKL